MKLYPQLSKYDILGLCTISGGMPMILKEFDAALNFEGNVRTMLEPFSAFTRFMLELLKKYVQQAPQLSSHPSRPVALPFAEPDLPSAPPFTA